MPSGGIIVSIIRFIAAAIVALLFLPIQAFAAVTGLYYTSSDQSWVGGGETVLVTPEDGFQFVVTRNFDNGVSFWINDFNSHSVSNRWWHVEFAAPNDEPLTVAQYQNATRFPFQSSDSAGLDFDGNGRGNNTLTGAFNVLEAVFAGDGTVLSFAADFVQYDEGVQSWWNVGSVRFNSSVDFPALPEPSTPVLLAIGLVLCVLASAARRRA
jgi:hypothetical protein